MHQLGTLVHRCAKNQVSSLSHLARMAVHDDDDDNDNNNINTRRTDRDCYRLIYRSHPTADRTLQRPRFSIADSVNYNFWAKLLFQN